MKHVYIMNENLLDILEGFRELFIDRYDVTKTNTFLDGGNREYWIGDDYLESIQIGHDGSPESARSYCLKPDHDKSSNLDYRKSYIRLDERLKTELGVQNSALSQFYPAGGYIGWHTNENASSYNLIFTWSETGDGYFEWVDPVTKDHFRMKDKKGWTCKAGYFGSSEETDKIIYHCASTDSRRITLSYTLGFSLEFWEDVIDHINTV